MIRNSNKIKNSRSDKIYLAIVYLFLGLFIISIIYPLLYVISCSFSSPEALVSGRVFFLPVEPGLQGYKAVFRNNNVWTGFKNSFIYTAIYAFLGTITTYIGGFVLSRQEFHARKAITTLFMVTMFFGGGLMPSYLLINKLGLMNSMWALILPGIYSVWLGFIAKTFIQSTIPEDLFESTCLDGGDYFRFLLSVALPLSKPILAVLALNFATGMWNSYFSAMIYLNSPAKFPLQLVLRQILIQNTIDYNSLTGSDALSLVERQYLSELLKYSLILVASVPLLIIYPMLQKYFIKGVMIGSIKG